MTLVPFTLHKFAQLTDTINFKKLEITTVGGLASIDIMLIQCFMELLHCFKNFYDGDKRPS